MTVKELITELEKIENKNLEVVAYGTYRDSYVLIKDECGDINRCVRIE